MRRIGAKAALWFLVPALAFSLGLGLVSTAVSAAESADPTWRMTNPITGAQDTATYLDTGETRLNVKASPGYGTRLTMSALGEGAYFDVKDFSTTFCLEKMQTNITLLISLQTWENGTLNTGGTQGNGLHVMIRKAGENSFDWAVYEQTGDPALDFQLAAGDLGENKNVTVKFHYDPEASNIVIQTDGTLNATVTNGSASGDTLAELFDKYYAETNYKAFPSC